MQRGLQLRERNTDVQRRRRVHTGNVLGRLRRLHFRQRLRNSAQHNEQLRHVRPHMRHGRDMQQRRLRGCELSEWIQPLRRLNLHRYPRQLPAMAGLPQHEAQQEQLRFMRFPLSAVRRRSLLHLTRTVRAFRILGMWRRPLIP